MRRLFVQPVIFGLLASFVHSVAGATTPTPRLWHSLDLANFYQQSLQPEQVLSLESEYEAFLGLLVEQETAEPQGAALILHDHGQTADWPVLVQPLRSFLPTIGWSTLTIDLPLPPHESPGWQAKAEGDSPDISDITPEQRVTARLAVALAQLNQELNFNIAVIGIGEGGRWASRYLSERIAEEEKEGYALVLIDAPLFSAEESESLANLNITTLDLLTEDTSALAFAARMRKAAANRVKHENYWVIDDAISAARSGQRPVDHAIRRVWGWLKSHASGSEAQLGG